MAVNVSKTKCIIFKPKDTKINIGDNDGVIYDNNEIGQPVIKGKSLNQSEFIMTIPIRMKGLISFWEFTLTNTLSFDHYCAHVCAKIAKSNFIVNRAKYFLPHSSLRTLYFALIHPHILNCLPIYSCTSAKNITKI